MKQTIKYVIFVAVSFLAASIFTHFNKGIGFSEAYTLSIALLALYRTCKEEKDDE